MTTPLINFVSSLILAILLTIAMTATDLWHNLYENGTPFTPPAEKLAAHRQRFRYHTTLGILFLTGFFNLASLILIPEITIPALLWTLVTSHTLPAQLITICLLFLTLTGLVGVAYSYFTTRPNYRIK